MAVAGDDAALHELDRVTWSPVVTPSPPAQIGVPFFRDGRDPGNFLVAVVDGRVVGYAKLGRPHPVEAGRHVLEVQGLAVDPAHGRQGIGRLLIQAAILEARARGARKLSLRVLGGNAPARALYESSGFHLEGILEGEFLLDGRYVDDVLMAITLGD